MIDLVLKKIIPLIHFIGAFLQSYLYKKDGFDIFITALTLSFGIYLIAWIYSIFTQDISSLRLCWQFSLLVQLSYYLINTNSFTLEKTTFSIISIVHFLRLIIYLLLRNYDYVKPVNPARKFSSNNEDFSYYKLFSAFIPQFFSNFLVGSIFFIFLHSELKLKQAIYWNGLLMMVLGSMFENIADIQLYMFKKKILEKPSVMDFGLWALCRHPNYFGECLFWWGVYTCCVSQGYIFTIYVPLSITLLIRYFSIPSMERHLKNIHGIEYNNYKKRVSSLIPWIPKYSHILSKSIINDNYQKNPDIKNWKGDQKNVKLYENKKRFNKLKKNGRSHNYSLFYNTLQ